MHGRALHGNREISRLTPSTGARIGKAGGLKPMMNGREKSDSAVVAGKSANAGGRPPGESMEPRAGTEGNASQPGACRTPSRGSATPGLERVRQAAKERKEERLTALLHHVDVDLLRWAYTQL